MQMMIGQIAAVPNGGTTGGKNAQGSAGGFGNLLVQVVSGQGPAASAVSTPAGAQPGLAANLLGGSLATLLSAGSAEELDAKLTELLQLLQQDTADAVEPRLTEELQALLIQVDDLIASMLGVTGLRRMTEGPAEAGDGTAAAGSGGTPAAVKAEIQSALTQLQSLIRQGGSAAPSAVQSAEALKVVAELAHVLQDGRLQDGGEPDPEGAADASLQQIRIGASAHLQRLSQQSHAGGQFGPAAHEQTAAVSEAAPEQQPVQQVWASALQQAVEVKAAGGEAVKPAPQAVNVRQFADTMTGMIVRQFGITQTNGLAEARMMLMPEHLGQVDVRISIQNGQLTASFVTDNPAARDMLENQLAQLRSSLQTQGLQVDRLEVRQETGQGQLQSQLFQEQRHQGSGAFQQPKQSGERNSSGDDKPLGFESELVEHAAASGLGYGRAINITA